MDDASDKLFIGHHTSTQPLELYDIYVMATILDLDFKAVSSGCGTSRNRLA